MKNNFRGKQHEIIWAASWKVRPWKKRNTFYVFINRLFARAQHLDNQSPVYVYGGYENGRPVMLVYLDKKNMIGKVEQ